MAALTDTEQAEILRYLSYANWISVASSFQLGFPMPTQPEFLVRDAFTRIKDESLNLIRLDLDNLRCTERQISDSRSRLAASAVENIKMNENELAMLHQHMDYWRGMLANDLGVYSNPYGEVNGSNRSGGRMGRVTYG